MSTESVCRLCVENAKTYESLYDSNGQKSDVYLLVVKYFDETLINFERAQHLREICLKCLQKIQYFDHFQKIVIRAQEKLDAYKEVKRENNLTGYDEEFSSFHINDKSKHDLRVKENNLSNQCNNDAVYVCPEESEHIKVPKLEMVDAFSGDESIQSNHDEFLDYTPNAYSVCSDDRNQNIDQNESSSIEKSDETNLIHILKNKIRSPEDIGNNIAKLLPSVECGICNEKLSTFTHLVQHFKSEHPAKECYAVFCGKRFKTRSLLARHVRCLHSDPNDYTCKLCNKSFLFRKSLSLHMRAHKPIKRKRAPQRSPEDIDNFISKLMPTVQCGMCNEKLPTFTHLVLHFQSEHQEKKCYARCCGTVFKRRSRLVRHVCSMHSVSNDFSCKVCTKSFLLRKSLKLHMRKHKNGSSNIEKSDETNPVDKQKNKIISPKDVDNYIAKLLPSVECGMCKEKQPTFTHLVQHFKSEHQGNECYAMCCGKSYKRRYMLASHVNSVHALSCKFCTKSFSLWKSLKLHMRKHIKNGSNNIQKSDETDSVDKQKNKIRSPKDVDNYIAKFLPSVECGMCQEKHPTFTHLVQHFKSEHLANECSAMCCGKRFKTRSLLARHVHCLHSGPNDYTCKLCNQTFLLRKSLSLHMRAHKAAKRAPQRPSEDIDNFISKLLPSVQCGKCKEKLPTFTHLALHFLSEHPEEECFAMCCGKTIKSRCKLESHVSSSHSALKMDAAIAQLRPSLECVVCKETCTTYSLLQYHFESIHPFNQFYIMCCNRKLKDRPKLLEHLQIHENPNAFKCDVCNIPYTQRQYLLRHMRTYHPSSNVEFPKHITDPTKTSDCNNDAACVRPGESEHIEVPKIEIVDVFSGDENIQSNHEKFLDCAPSLHSLYTGLSDLADDRNQNIDQNESGSIEKSDETNPVNNLKNEIRSPEDIDKSIAKLLPNVEYACVRSEEIKHIEMPKLEIVDVFSGDDSVQSYHEEFLDSTLNADSVHSGFSVRSFSDDSNQNIDQNDSSSVEKAVETIYVDKVKNNMGLKRSAEDIDNNIAKILPNIECVMCKEKQPTFTHLLQHFKSEHPAKKCYAMCCGKKFKTRSRLASHVSTHCATNAYPCKHCNKIFLLRKSLILHMRTHHSIRSRKDIDDNIAKLLPSVECGVCREKQPTFTHLALHFTAEHPKKKCYAMCCGKMITNRSKLAKHVSSGHSAPYAASTSARTTDAAIAQLRPNLECVICKETCTSFSLLLYHFESKHPLDEFYITCCKRKLKDRFHLHQHLQFHENPNAFACNVCNKSFSERSSLLRHKRVSCYVQR